MWTGEEERQFGLEYERSLKSAKQYAKIRAALEGERQLSSILYLAVSPELMLALIYQSTPSSIPIAFATARSFRERNLATQVSVDARGQDADAEQLSRLCFRAVLVEQSSEILS